MIETDRPFRYIYTTFVVFMTVVAVIDLSFHFVAEGLSLHVVLEGTVVFFALATLVRLWFVFTRRLRDARQAAAEARGELDTFRKRHSSAIEQMRAAIHSQFDRWALTPGERRIAEALIRGHSIRQIAAGQSKQEQTVRNQAASVYAKSGMTGRSDLGAFFLTDILGEDE